MKHLFTLFLIVVCGGIGWAQPAFFQTEFQWDEPQFPQSFLIEHEVKAIQVNTYRGQAEPAGKVASGATYEYNEAGKLIQMVETQYDDTSKIHDFLYTDRGILRWLDVTDKTWNKTYRSGYRFTSNQSVFQVKSYELLRNDERMLLDTRQYVYTKDSLLKAIICREGNQTIRKHEYTYDDKKRVTEERFVNSEGEFIKGVSYAYDSTGQIVRIVTETVVKKDVHEKNEYRYEYKKNGQPIQVEWLFNEKPKGLVTYSYDESGKLQKMHRKVTSANQQESEILQVYEYDTFE